MLIVVVAVFSTAVGVGQKTYRVEPEITVPEYRTDAARAIDAYERLMERYMDLTEKGFKAGGDMKSVDAKLSAIESKLTELCGRMARIEKALGIEQPLPSVVENAPQLKAPERGTGPNPSSSNELGPTAPEFRRDAAPEASPSARK
jgi:hypothetical protein